MDSFSFLALNVGCSGFVMNGVQAEGLMDREGHSLDLERPAGGIANEQEGNFNTAVEDGMNQEKVSSTPCSLSTFFQEMYGLLCHHVH